MKKNDNDAFIAPRDRKLLEIHAKLVSVYEIGEFDSFHFDWNVPEFKSHSEKEDWIRKNVFERGQSKSYYARLERIAAMPKVSISLDDLYYLEYFLLMGKMPAVTVDVLHPEKKGFQINRIWETGDLFFRLSKAQKEGRKFTELARHYTNLMPEKIKRTHGSVKTSKLRKAYSRGKDKANTSKKNY